MVPEGDEWLGSAVPRAARLRRRPGRARRRFGPAVSRSARSYQARQYVLLSVDGQTAVCFRGELPLDDQIGAAKLHERIAEEVREDRTGTRKRQVGDDREGLGRPRPPKHVDLDDLDVLQRLRRFAVVRRVRSRARARSRVRPVRERASDHAAAGADLDDDVTGPDSGPTDERRLPAGYCEGSAGRGLPLWVAERPRTNTVVMSAAV